MQCSRRIAEDLKGTSSSSPVACDITRRAMADNREGGVGSCKKLGWKFEVQLANIVLAVAAEKVSDEYCERLGSGGFVCVE